MNKLLVIGSMNMDMTVYVDETPKPGETVYGHDFLLSPGGKGANQALAASRLGAQVTLLGRVGDDLFGHTQIDGLTEAGVDTSAVIQTPGIATGVANIQVVRGENSIVLAPGANEHVSPQDIDAIRDLMAECDAVMMQFEIPMPAVERAIALAKTLNKRIFLTPAPVVAFDDALLDGLYMLLPNEHEAQRITGIETESLAGAERALLAFVDKGVQYPLITLGSKGVLYWDGERAVHAPSRKVQAVDTTGAGDTFTGALTAALLSGEALGRAVQFAQSAAALCVMRKGAQCAIPSRDETLAFMGVSEV